MKNPDYQPYSRVRNKHTPTLINFWIFFPGATFLLFHNWTSELGCIWHIFGKFGSFQVLEHWQQPVFKKLRRQQPDAACTGALKKSQKIA